VARSLALVSDPAAPRSVVGEIDARSCDFKRKMKKFSTSPILSSPRSRAASLLVLVSPDAHRPSTRALR
jgi:hypothetical protein